MQPALSQTIDDGLDVSVAWIGKGCAFTPPLDVMAVNHHITSKDANGIHDVIDVFDVALMLPCFFPLDASSISSMPFLMR